MDIKLTSSFETPRPSTLANAMTAVIRQVETERMTAWKETKDAQAFYGFINGGIAAFDAGDREIEGPTERGYVKQLLDATYQILDYLERHQYLKAHLEYDNLNRFKDIAEQLLAA